MKLSKGGMLIVVAHKRSPHKTKAICVFAGYQYIFYKVMSIVCTCAYYMNVLMYATCLIPLAFGDPNFGRDKNDCAGVRCAMGDKQ
jgi:hypothetical protein